MRGCCIAVCFLLYLHFFKGQLRPNRLQMFETHLTGSRCLTGRVKESVANRMAEAAQATLKQVPSKIPIFLLEKVDVPICMSFSFAG